jgi:hypothetical protein
MNLEQRVRKRILAEGPQHESQARADAYVHRELAAMTSGELLQRISDELENMLAPEVVEHVGPEKPTLSILSVDDLLT